MAENVIKFRAEFNNEMLEQIRAVVREELQGAMKPPLLEGNVPTSEELTEKLKKWEPLIISSETVSGTIAQNGKLTTLGRQLAEEAQHYLTNNIVDNTPVSVTAELVHEGRLYRGVLNFVRDIE